MFTFDHLPSGINRRTECLVILYSFVDSPHRLDNTAEFDRPNGCAGKKRREKKVIAGTYNRNVEIINVYALQQTEAREACTENDEVRSICAH
jgi:hypothetical protein